MGGGMTTLVSLMSWPSRSQRMTMLNDCPVDVAVQLGDVVGEVVSTAEHSITLTGAVPWPNLGMRSLEKLTVPVAQEFLSRQLATGHSVSPR
jgi:hypothetical protein